MYITEGVTFTTEWALKSEQIMKMVYVTFVFQILMNISAQLQDNILQSLYIMCVGKKRKKAIKSIG